MVRIFDWVKNMNRTSLNKIIPLVISWFLVLLFTSIAYYDYFYNIMCYDDIFLILFIIWVPSIPFGVIIHFKKKVLGDSIGIIALATFFPLMIAISRKMIWIEFIFLVLIVLGINFVYKRNLRHSRRKNKK